jgi:tRNA(fMet)-specific endonuclease VapC
MYLIDTNHCSRFLRGDPAILKKIAVIDSELVQTCVIVSGELIYMAHFSEKKDYNIDLFQAFLSQIKIHPIDKKCADTYGCIKSDLREHLGPKEKKQRRKFDLVKDGGISDNDLWIASIAISRNLVVVSADTDFSRISEIIKDLQVENWLTS